jgi:hypothetical protein
MAPSTTVEWILRREHADVRCTRCETDGGIELTVTFGGLLVARFVTSTLAHAAAWAANRRESWQAAGWSGVALARAEVR